VDERGVGVLMGGASCALILINKDATLMDPRGRDLGHRAARGLEHQRAV
jgi:hypothetical protein